MDKPTLGQNFIKQMAVRIVDTLHADGKRMGFHEDPLVVSMLMMAGAMEEISHLEREINGLEQMKNILARDNKQSREKLAVLKKEKHWLKVLVLKLSSKLEETVAEEAMLGRSKEVFDNLAARGALKKGLDMHMATSEGLEGDAFICNILEDIYAKCGSSAEVGVFNQRPAHDMLWIARMTGHGKGNALKTLDPEVEPEGERLKLPDSEVREFRRSGKGNLPETLVPESEVLTGFQKGGSRLPLEGNELVYIPVSDLEEGSSLTSPPGKLEGAMYEQNAGLQGFGTESPIQGHNTRQFEELYEKDPTASEIVKEGWLEKGLEVCNKLGIEVGNVAGCFSINLIAKFGFLANTQHCFNEWPSKYVVTWTTPSLGYVECGSSMEAMEKGWKTHAQLVSEGLETDQYFGSALLDMYTRCGALAKAEQVLKEFPGGDVVAWSALIT